MTIHLARLFIRAGFVDEDIIVNALNITHVEYRRLLPSTTGLTKGAATEIIERQFDVTQPKLAKMYKVPASHIHSVRQRENKRTTPYTDDELFELYIAYDTLEEMQQVSKIQIYTLIKRFKQLGILHDVNLIEDEVIAALTTDETHASIAKRLGTTASKITTIAQKNGLQRRDTVQYNMLSEADWYDIVQEHKKGMGVTTLAKKYNVSRPAIYRRINK